MAARNIFLLQPIYCKHVKQDVNVLSKIIFDGLVGTELISDVDI